MKRTIASLAALAALSLAVVAGAELVESQFQIESQKTPSLANQENSVLPNYGDRMEMKREIDGQLEAVRSEVSKLVADLPYQLPEAQIQTQRQIEALKKQGWAETYRIQSRWAKKEGRIDDAAQLELKAERTLNPPPPGHVAAKTSDRRRN